ncbi:spore germination protein KA [Paenibacillus forsythiae]|uniref:Spore germination protein KA n=1 Tax=Paenibacillus forsythiae TaxID=365616 RepID=A0ABU3H275_9BACL|nr:spore germination protein [Paenibacillus forsythiae]MDT3424918.1 spore germination protein KA [Paenibacillus forsythiae]
MSFSPPEQLVLPPLETDLEANLEMIRAALGNSQDLIIKTMNVINGWPAAILYLQGMVDNQVLQVALGSLMQPTRIQPPEPAEGKSFDLMRYIANEVLVAGECQLLEDTRTLFLSLLSGRSILLLGGAREALAVGTNGGEERAVTEPTSQAVVRGPMEGFTESIRTNISLIRRRIKSMDLRIESYNIGRQTQTEVAVLYMNTIVRKEVLEQLRQRLQGIDIDGVLESGYIEEFIQETSFTPFPTVFNTDRPDTASAALLEGRVAIIVDGTPFVLLVPALFMQFFQSAEDYYQRSDISTLLRIVRVSSLFISMLVPALYISFTTFHQEMLPTPMLISLAAQREVIPFPAFVEALLMEFVYEVLREAGVRMPRTVGQAVSIVGTLVIGQAAVEAGIISAAMVIIVSITAISSFVIPSVSMSISIRMIRFGMMLLAGAFGFVGIFMGIFMLTIHLAGLRSFGAPYMSPFSPSPEGEWKDSLLRAPWPYMRKRPSTARQGSRRRQNLKGGGEA